MNRQKNGFLTFCFAFIPGAGQMYLGFMKRGLSLMGLFAAVCGITLFYGIELLVATLPVIWFYAFFDTFNLRSSLCSENNITDSYLFSLGDHNSKEWISILNKRHRIIGIALIFIGAYTILDRVLARWFRAFAGLFSEAVQNIIHSVINSVPTVFISLVIIFIGIKLIKSPTKRPDYIDYKGVDEDE